MSQLDSMIEELSQLAEVRYHTALQEGMTPQEAFKEIVRTILENYREALAQ